MSTGVRGGIVMSGSRFGGAKNQSQGSYFPQDSVRASRLLGSELVIDECELGSVDR